MQILEKLRVYQSSDDKEAQSITETITWIEKHGTQAFVRENLEGHVTGSMLITDPSFSHVLLMHHKKLNRWQQFGGHSDGDIDSERVAVREFNEESWINQEPSDRKLFDVDAHRVPERGHEPEHTHFDIVFIGTIPLDTRFHAQEAEVNDIKWFTVDEAKSMDIHDRMRNMLTKLEALRK